MITAAAITIEPILCSITLSLKRKHVQEIFRNYFSLIYPICYSKCIVPFRDSLGKTFSCSLSPNAVPRHVLSLRSIFLVTRDDSNSTAYIYSLKLSWK